MRRLVLVVFLGVLSVLPAAAQEWFYVGGIVAADAGSRGGFDTLGTFPAAGGVFGVRFHEAWSLEVQIDRGFGTSPERDHLEIYGHSTVQDRAGAGSAVLVAWRPRLRSRVGAAVTMGIAVRQLRTHTLSVTKAIPDDPYPAKTGVTYDDAGAGWAGGVLFPIALGGRWSVAPELRVTVGLTGESSYAQVYPGVRVMWGF